jgi:hypothetical protein
MILKMFTDKKRIEMHVSPYEVGLIRTALVHYFDALDRASPPSAESDYAAPRDLKTIAGITDLLSGRSPFT